MADEIIHTSWAAQREFLDLSPEQQNLKIWMSSQETNGKVAQAMRDIAELTPLVKRHDFVFKVAALAFAAIIASGPFIIAFGGRLTW